MQRVSSRLKTCDIVFLNPTTYKIQTINQSEIEKITDTVKCPIYMMGPDPLEWSKIFKTSVQNNWELEDWQYFLEDKNSDIDDNNSSDDDWVPGSEDESEDEDIED